MSMIFKISPKWPGRLSKFQYLCWVIEGLTFGAILFIIIKDLGIVGNNFFSKQDSYDSYISEFLHPK
jgi:hypothetical protein